MTLRLSVDPQNPDTEILRKAAEILRSGGLVAFPTETVYGLGAAANLPEAVARLKEVKRRPEDKPFSYLLPEPEAVEALVESVPRKAKVLMDRYWPGPLTLVLPRSPGSTEHVGVRVTASPVARRLLELTGTPVLVPSANPSGEPPAVRPEEVLRYFEGRIDALVEGGEAVLKEASTVVRFEGERYEVLREGTIGAQAIRQLLEGKKILFVCTGNTCRSPMAQALFARALARKLGEPVERLVELGYRVESAGTFAGFGARANPHAVEVMREKGCDISEHRTRPITEELLAEADRIYVMTPSHRETLLLMAPAVRDKVFVLAPSGIPDPIGGDIEEYRLAAEEIERAVRRIVEEF